MYNETIETIENMIKTIKEDIVRNRMNSYLTNNLKIKYEKETYQLSTLSSQKNNNSGTILDFPDCEKELKNAYLLDDDIDLIIFKMDYFFEDFFIPITEYQLFHPFNFSLLDLKYCKDIIIKIPLEIDESELYKHNPNSEYYTNGDNKILNERKKLFKENNLSICERDCTFQSYDKINKNVICNCKIKTSFSPISHIYNNKNSLLFYFFNIFEEQFLNAFKSIYNNELNNSILDSMISQLISKGEKKFNNQR